MNWNSIQRNPNEARGGTRQRLLAILAAQGVLTEALLARSGDDDDVLEIEITDFEGCLGDDDEDLDDEDDEEDEEEEAGDEEENEASGSSSRRRSENRPATGRESVSSSGGPRGERGKKRQSQ